MKCIKEIVNLKKRIKFNMIFLSKLKIYAKMTWLTTTKLSYKYRLSKKETYLNHNSSKF